MIPRLLSFGAPRGLLTHRLAPRANSITLPRPAAYYYSSSSPSTQEAAARRAEARNAWIARLKEEHGDNWEAVVRESEERAARNEARIRQQHKELKEERRRKAEEREKAAAKSAKWPRKDKSSYESSF